MRSGEKIAHAKNRMFFLKNMLFFTVKNNFSRHYFLITGKKNRTKIVQIKKISSISSKIG